MSSLHPLHAQLSAILQARHNLAVNATWLNDFLQSRGTNPPPLAVLASTAHFRILASDITATLSPTGAADVFPAGVADVNVKEHLLGGTVITQVLDVLDVGSSKWSQVEAIERVERGEEVRGREVIRTVDVMDGDNNAPAADPASAASAGARLSTSNSTSNSNSATTSSKLSLGPHKLLLQDVAGTKVLAFELVKVPKIGLSVAASVPVPQNQGFAGAAAAAVPASDDPGMFIGCKLLLKPGTVVRRGMVMLTPGNCVSLGGKVEAWDRKWKEQRKERLAALIRDENVTTAE